jgi:hypothetical protein
MFWSRRQRPRYEDKDIADFVNLLKYECSNHRCRLELSSSRRILGSFPCPTGCGGRMEYQFLHVIRDSFLVRAILE